MQYISCTYFIIKCFFNVFVWHFLLVFVKCRETGNISGERNDMYQSSVAGTELSMLRLCGMCLNK